MNIMISIVLTDVIRLLVVWHTKNDTSQLRCRWTSMDDAGHTTRSAGAPTDNVSKLRAQIAFREAGRSWPIPPKLLARYEHLQCTQTLRARLQQLMCASQTLHDC